MSERSKVTMRTLFSKVEEGTPISMVTCYDYSMASLVEDAAIDIVLVGDSLGMTMMGYDGTLPVTMDDMVRYGIGVRRGTPNSWLVGDMPYMSYQASDADAVRNAGRLMAEIGCDCVKLEGGTEVAPRMQAIVSAGIPVMGHIGLTPQSVSSLGGFRVQGKDAGTAARLVGGAIALEAAGTAMILVEMVPDRVCGLITESVSVPIISLGSGPHAHGQLLIFHDMFGLYPNFKPRMAKSFGDAGKLIRDGLTQYAQQVASRAFPAAENIFSISDDQYHELLELVGTLMKADKQGTAHSS